MFLCRLVFDVVFTVDVVGGEILVCLKYPDNLARQAEDYVSTSIIRRKTERSRKSTSL